MQCSSEDKKHRSHDSISIQDALTFEKAKWKLTIENFKTLKVIIDEKYPLIENLIKYLDNEGRHHVRLPSH